MTDRYAVIGNPVSHSKSPLIHAWFAEQTAQDMSYQALHAPLDNFVGTVNEFIEKQGQGANITIPFKRQAYELATMLTDRARVAEAVNTLKITGNDILGDNTDGAGLVTDLESNLKFSLTGKRILLLGAGGAAHGAVMPLMEKQPRVLYIVNRTPHKALELSKRFAAYGNIKGGGYESIDSQAFDLIINATAASLNNTLPAIPGNAFTGVSLAYDMMYAAGGTPFLNFATQCGVTQCADGLGMLVEQAAESFYLWRGVRPSTQQVLRRLRISNV